MTRRDVWLSIAVSVLSLVILDYILPTFGVLIGLFLFDAVLQVWYVGVALVVVSFVLTRRRAVPTAARVVGCIGVWWLTFVVSYIVILVGMFAVFGGLTG
jgi:hypothetical protein